MKQTITWDRGRTSPGEVKNRSRVASAEPRPLYRVTEARGGRFTVDVGEADLPSDRTNLCVRAFESLHSADGISFTIRSEIPVSAGLGSSAAAIVAGLVAADHMFELDAPLFNLAVELEGHPDNVGAALYGGFVICADGTAERFEAAPGIEAVLAIPPSQVATEDARAAMPQEVPIDDAIHNAAHTALLVLGLVRGDLDLVARGLHDRLHQQRRAHLYPRSMELVANARELGAVGASISGAGPAVMFWCHWQQTGTLIENLRAAAPDCKIQRAQLSPGGADVRAL